MDSLCAGYAAAGALAGCLVLASRRIRRRPLARRGSGLLLGVMLGPATLTSDTARSTRAASRITVAGTGSVHRLGVCGVKAPTVFKLTRRPLAPGRPLATGRATRSTVPIRRVVPGPRQIDVQVNGRVLGSTQVIILDMTGRAAAPADRDAWVSQLGVGVPAGRHPVRRAGAALLSGP